MDSKEHPSIKIKSLQDLEIALTEEDPAKYNRIFRSMDVPISTFEEYCSWSEECYTRNCIVENDKFELILLCWEKGQKTPIHDHGGEECWVKVIQGEFKEELFQKDNQGKLNLVHSIISRKNNITYMIDFKGFHSLENHSDERSMSLHLYAKPIRSCNIYDEESKCFEKKELEYNTFA